MGLYPYHCFASKLCTLIQIPRGSRSVHFAEWSSCIDLCSCFVCFTPQHAHSTNALPSVTRHDS